MKQGLTDIVYCVDENDEYRRMAEISVHSLLSSCRSGLNVRVFFPPWAPPSENEIRRYRAIAAAGGPHIVLGTMPSKYGQMLQMSSSMGRMKLGSMCYARFLIPLVLQDVGQCLYVDCDTLFTKDPTPFLDGLDHESMSFHHTAGVRDLVGLIRPERFYSSPWYVNSGVLLMDLDLWRKHDLPQRYMFDAFTENRHFNDQDTINANCSPASLPCELNFIGAWLNFDVPVSRYNEIYGKSFSSMQEAVSSSAVLHYTGGMKPLRRFSGKDDIPVEQDCMFEPYYQAYTKYAELTGKDRR
jgi:lipopolysaccharide biosynthesis glycosyltransferase